MTKLRADAVPAKSRLDGDDRSTSRSQRLPAVAAKVAISHAEPLSENGVPTKTSIQPITRLRTDVGGAGGLISVGKVGGLYYSRSFCWADALIVASRPSSASDGARSPKVPGAYFLP